MSRRRRRMRCTGCRPGRGRRKGSERSLHRQLVAGMVSKGTTEGSNNGKNGSIGIRMRHQRLHIQNCLPDISRQALHTGKSHSRDKLNTSRRRRGRRPRGRRCGREAPSRQRREENVTNRQIGNCRKAARSCTVCRQSLCNPTIIDTRIKRERSVVCRQSLRNVKVTKTLSKGGTRGNRLSNRRIHKILLPYHIGAQ